MVTELGTKYDYRANVYEAVKDYLKETYNHDYLYNTYYYSGAYFEEFVDTVFEDAISSDDVTGARSETYYNVPGVAADRVSQNQDLLEECLKYYAYMGEKPGPEQADVMIRCYVMATQVNIAEAMLDAIHELEDEELDMVN